MKVVMAHKLRLLALIAVLAGGGATLALASMEPVSAVDWSQYADVETVVVVTTDADGAQRETTIWLAVVEGSAFIRTGGTRWGDNVEREPAIALRIEATEIPVRAEFVEDDGLRGTVVAAFREKYGFTDRVMDLFRGARPRIMRVERRP